MSKRTFLIFVVVVLLVIGTGFTTIESTSIQSDMTLFEEQLTTNGVTSVINNSSTLGDIALKMQSLIDLILSAILSFFQKLIGLFN